MGAVATGHVVRPRSGVLVVVAVGLVAGVLAAYLLNRDQGGSGRSADTIAAAAFTDVTAVAALPLTTDVAVVTERLHRLNAILGTVDEDPAVRTAFVRLLERGGPGGGAAGARAELVTATTATEEGALARELASTSRFGWFTTLLERVGQQITRRVVEPFVRQLQGLAGLVGVGSELAQDPRSTWATDAVEASKRGDFTQAAQLVDPSIFPKPPCGSGSGNVSCVDRTAGSWHGSYKATATMKKADGTSKTCSSAGTADARITTDGSQVHLNITLHGLGGEVNDETCEIRGRYDVSLAFVNGMRGAVFAASAGTNQARFTFGTSTADGAIHHGSPDVTTVVLVGLDHA